MNSHFSVGMVGDFSAAAAPYGADVAVVERSKSVDLLCRLVAGTDIRKDHAAVLFRDSQGVRDFIGGLSTEGLNDATRRLVDAIRALATGEYRHAGRHAANFLPDSPRGRA